VKKNFILKKMMSEISACADDKKLMKETQNRYLLFLSIPRMGKKIGRRKKKDGSYSI
jgi:hypothetical protein